MAKKSFKGGLSSLLSGSLPNDTVNQNKEKHSEKKTTELTEEEQHFLQIKIDRLQKELHLWRTGQLDVESFKESLETKGLKYDSEKNIIY